MKYFPFSVIVIFLLCSCFNSSLKENKETLLSKPLSQTSFECDYVKCKVRSHTLYKQYITKPDLAKKEALLTNIRDSLLACWYGTEWDFYGTTETPGKGKIACGYFVTTLLRDMGASVKRI